MKKKFWIKLTVLLSLIVVILTLDLVTKYVFDGLLQLGEGMTVIPYLFNFINVHNFGAAWGIFAGNQLGLIILSIVFFIVFLLFYIKEKKKSWLLTVSFAFLTAGCFGNLFDRLIFGYVRDFIQFAFWQSFPVFNFADVFLTVGVALFLIYLIIPIFKKKEHKKDTINKDDNNEEIEQKLNLDNSATEQTLNKGEDGK